MTDLVLRDLAPDLAGRIRKLAELQGRSAMMKFKKLPDQVKLRKQLDLEEQAALKEAIAALERVPDDAGFGLIGRL